MEVSSVDVAGLVAREECDNVSDFAGLGGPTERHEASKLTVEALQVSACPASPSNPRVSVLPGLIAFTRIPRSLSSSNQVRTEGTRTATTGYPTECECVDMIAATAR